ncbi:MAG: hypothetical protein WBA07_11030 [Rivularia sp. (in: cyanobacteria)]
MKRKSIVTSLTLGFLLPLLSLSSATAINQKTSAKSTTSPIN